MQLGLVSVASRLSARRIQAYVQCLPAMGAEGAKFWERFGKAGLDLYYRGFTLPEAERQLAATAIAEPQPKPAPIAAAPPAELKQTKAVAPDVVTQALAKLRPQPTPAEKL